MVYKQGAIDYGLCCKRDLFLVGGGKMAAFTRIEEGIAINTAKPGRSLFDIVQYIEAHIDEWVGKQVIWDLSLFNFSEHQPADFSAYFGQMRLLTAKRAGLKTALVVHSDTAFLNLQTFVSLIEGNLGIRLKLFKTIEDALAWVGVRNAACRKC